MLAVALAVALARLALWLLLVAASLHLLRGAAWALRHPLPPPPPAAAVETLPFLTLQLPLRNEPAVAPRLLAAAGALDWPRDRFEIQVLDDSDDETRALVDRAAADLAERGLAITVIRRDDRRGFKAGALEHGLASARGALIAVLDADAQPPPDLLRRLATPLLAEPRRAFVQARWSFDDEGGLLRRLQALILDGLMALEQPRLGALGRPVQFNGTGGLWRREALLAAGGWMGGATTASVTEDLDLSYRAALAGHRGLTVAELAVQTELPPAMAAFRAQQERWVRGGAEVLRGLGRRLRREGASPLSMLAHLARHARQPLLFAAALWLPLSALDLVVAPLTHPLIWPLVLGLVIAAAAAYYGAARRRLGRSPVPALLLAPPLLALSMGLGLTLAVAFARGLLGGRGAFVRTPKRGDQRRARDRAPISPIAAVEIAVGLANLAAAVIALTQGRIATAMALGGLVAIGFLWVGIGSVIDR